MGRAIWSRMVLSRVERKLSLELRVGYKLKSADTKNVLKQQ